MEFNVEKTISNFIESQFPSFYHEEGADFILFVKAYYEWLEEQNSPVREARELLNYRDIDNTIEAFLEYFQKKYLYGIPFNIITSKRFLLKHILDVYRSKGSIQSYKLLFKLVYGEDVDVYLPGRDLLKPSDGIWNQPKYLELTDNIPLDDYVGKEIIGSISGTSAVVESYIKKSLYNRSIAVLYISNINPNGADFTIDERIILKSDVGNQDKLLSAPMLLGSLDKLRILKGGINHKVGDAFNIAKYDLQTNQVISYGIDGKVGATELAIGNKILFELVNGGFGYNSNSNIFVYNNIEDKVGKNAMFNISSFAFQKPITYNRDLICNAVLVGGAINDTTYSYMSNTSANLTTTIGNTLTWVTENFGSIGSIESLSTGDNYTRDATVFVRSTNDSRVLPGNVSYSSTNTRVYSISYSGIASGFTNSDIITVSNPAGTNAVATITTNSSGGNLQITITNYGSNFPANPNSDIIVTTTSGTGVIFSATYLPYVTGVGTNFTSVLTSNSVIKLQANSSVANTEKIVVKQVVNATSLFLYSSPSLNSTASAKYYIAPTTLPSQFASYDSIMLNYDNQTFGENEVILAPVRFSQDSISEVRLIDSGFGYSDQEIVKCYSYGSISNNFTIIRGGVNYANNEKIYFSSDQYPTTEAYGYITTNSNGTITSITLTNSGSGYLSPPIVVVKSANGSGAILKCSLSETASITEILGKVSLKGYGTGKGYWETTDGFLNADKYIQDSYYYQDYSYELQAARTLETYKNILYNTFHSSGAELFGKVLMFDSTQSNNQVIYENTTTS